MRSFVRISVCSSALCLGCGEAASGPRAHQPPVKEQAVEAARVFAIAENLERQGKAREATAAYRHILREFPRTDHGKKAAARIRLVQRGR